MKGVVIASHMSLAEGMLEALELFVGKQDQLSVIGLRPGEDLASFAEEIANAACEVDLGNGVIVFCDLPFGTPCNMACRLLRKEDYQHEMDVVAGMNLPMILECLNSRDNEDVSASHLISVGREGIMNMNEVLDARGGQ